MTTPNPTPVAQPLNRYFCGLDLGQQRDYTALTIIQAVNVAGQELPDLHCRHLQRWPLGTGYPDIVTDVCKLLRHPTFQPDRTRLVSPALPTLAIDGTGVGAAVVDLFKKAEQAWELRVSRFLPVMITGGDAESKSNGYHRVPKRNLVGIVQAALQTGRLQVAEALTEAATLQQELLNFQVKVTLAANDVYGAWREGTHDDLVLATALALWAAQKPVGGFFSF